MSLLLIACIIALLGLLLIKTKGVDEETSPYLISLFMFCGVLVLLYFGNSKWELSIDGRGIFNGVVGMFSLILVPGTLMCIASLFTDDKDIVEKVASFGCLSIILGGLVMFIAGVGGVVFDSIVNPEPDCIVMENGQSNCTDVEGGPGDYNNPGVHGVKGHYRNGTYVEPYIRSNPDGDTSNNLNP